MDSRRNHSGISSNDWRNGRCPALRRLEAVPPPPPPTESIVRPLCGCGGRTRRREVEGICLLCLVNILGLQRPKLLRVCGSCKEKKEVFIGRQDQWTGASSNQHFGGVCYLTYWITFLTHQKLQHRKLTLLAMKSNDITIAIMCWGSRSRPSFGTVDF